MLAIRGMDLSGGQKQRLLITRALAKHPQILVLDDSSSALDYATDARLRRAIQENYGDLTSIIVAQRISSIYRADKIIVLFCMQTTFWCWKKEKRSATEHMNS